MPDITMCTNKDCYKKEDCYRFMANPSKKQSYSYFLPIQDCFIYIDTEGVINGTK